MNTIGQLGNGSTAIGNKALNKQVVAANIGRDNTAVGHESLENLDINQNESTAVGAQALTDNAIGENSAFGAYALARVAGTRNTGVGAWAGRYIIGGNDNTSMGHRAMAGDENTEGEPSTYPNGEKNTAFGESAMRYSPDGDENTALGYHSMYTINGNASGNTAVGAYSLANIKHVNSDPNSGMLNTAVGDRSGVNVAKGHDNTFLGANSGKKITNGSSNTFIGTNADSGTDANAAIGVYRGAFGADAIVEQDNSIVFGRSDPSGTLDKIGIRTTTPSAALHLKTGNASDNGILAETAGNGNAITANTTAAGNAISVNTSSGGNGINVINSSTGNGININTTGSASGLNVLVSNTGHGIVTETITGTGIPLKADTLAPGVPAIMATTFNTGNAIQAQTSILGGGAAIKAISSNANSSYAIDASTASSIATGSAINATTSAGAEAIKVTTTSSGLGINATTSGSNSAIKATGLSTGVALEVDGGHRNKALLVAGNYNITINDYIIIGSGPNPITFTLPAVTTAQAGSTFIIRNAAVGNLTINTPIANPIIRFGNNDTVLSPNEVINTNDARTYVVVQNAANAYYYRIA